MSPKILAVETSSAFSSLAFFDGKKTRVFHPKENARHSESLFVSLAAALKASRARLADVDLFAVGLGPGSFTGLRVGVVSVKTLAYALGKKIVGISSLATVEAANPGADWVAIDAKRGNVFGARFKNRRAAGSPRMRPAAEFIEDLRKGERVTGDALALYAENVARAVGREGLLGGPASWLPRAENMIPEALRRWGSGDFDDALRLAPQYLYDNASVATPPKIRKAAAR